jgi:hypothetical protein
MPGLAIKFILYAMDYTYCQLAISLLIGPFQSKMSRFENVARLLKEMRIAVLPQIFRL